MSHPFAALFKKALARSSPDENFVLEEAIAIKEKGYNPDEIYEVLVTMQKGLIQDEESVILKEAVEVFSQYVEEEE